MKEIPGINEKTGIGLSYWNQFYSLTMMLATGTSVLEIATALTEAPPLKYGEMYRQSEYKDPINDSNRKAISSLDRIVEEIRSSVKNPEKITSSFLQQKVDDARRLIYG